MVNDIIFKTQAFGGFKKGEVMTFIGNLISEKQQLEERCKSLTETCNSLNSKLEDFEKISNSLNEFKENNEVLKQQNSELIKENESLKTAKEELNEKNNENAELKEKNANLNSKLVEVSDELSEIKNKPVLTEEQAEVLKAENLRFKNEYEKMKAMEQQVGAAMLDARLRSDELIKEAQEKAGLVTKDVYNAIGDTALKIDDLSSGITEIAKEFTKAVTEVEMRINVLTGNMSKTAQALISGNIDIPSVSAVNESSEKVKVVSGYQELVDDAKQSISQSVAMAESEIEAVKEEISVSITENEV